MSIWRRLLEALGMAAPVVPSPPDPSDSDDKADDEAHYEEGSGEASAMRATGPVRPARQAPPIRAAPVPASSPDESRLYMLLDRASRETAGSATLPLADASFWVSIDRLLYEGRERTTIELLRRFALLRPNEPALAARLVELWCARLEHVEAVPFLEQLTTHPAYALRARLLLAEACERAGDLEAARRRYEELLSADIDHPGVRARHARLRAAVRPRTLLGGDDTPAASVLLPTLLGLDGQGPGLAERYRLRSELGRGTMGTVYLAFDEELGREVALKLLHARTARLGLRGQERAQSFNEARLAAALRHPGVLAIYDLDEERGLVAMERCGETLRTRLSRGALSVDEAIGRAGELLRTLGAVHRAGVVHRDLKPANLLFRAPPPLAGEAEALVLGDFGLAHWSRSTGGAIDTSTERHVAGTLAYMGNEARQGEMAAPGDVYAAGVVLVEMLVGRLPVEPSALLQAPLSPDRAAAVLTAALLGEPRRPKLVELARRLLCADAAARPDAAEAAAMLDALAR